MSPYRRAGIIEEGSTTCCYAQSDKQWIADPEGVAWETFLTHGTSTVYGNTLDLAPLDGGGCCTPNMKPVSIGVAIGMEAAPSACSISSK